MAAVAAHGLHPGLGRPMSSSPSLSGSPSLPPGSPLLSPCSPPSSMTRPLLHWFAPLSSTSPWEPLELSKVPTEARGDPPLLRAVEAARLVAADGAGLPSAELAGILVSNLCFAHNSALLCKLLDQAMSSRLLCPLHVLALLTARVLPQRRAQPEAFRLYLELLKSNVTSSSLSLHAGSNFDKMTKSINAALQLSKIYEVPKIDFAHVVILFVLSVSVTTKLIDSVLEDCGFPSGMVDGPESVYPIEGPHAMELDVKGISTLKQSEHREQLRRKNTVMALEVLHMMVADKKIQTCVRLIQVNIYIL